MVSSSVLIFDVIDIIFPFRFCDDRRYYAIDVIIDVTINVPIIYS